MFKWIVRRFHEFQLEDSQNQQFSLFITTSVLDTKFRISPKRSQHPHVIPRRGRTQSKEENPFEPHLYCSSGSVIDRPSSETIPSPLFFGFSLTKPDSLDDHGVTPPFTPFPFASDPFLSSPFLSSPFLPFEHDQEMFDLYSQLNPSADELKRIQDLL